MKNVKLTDQIQIRQN